jgi:hypothetical protein
MKTPDRFDTYLFSYRHLGKDWCFDIQATSPADAKARLAMLATAQYDGLQILSAPVPAATSGLLLRGIRLFQRLVN